MAIQNKATIKSYFQTGDAPTQSDFEDFIDSSVAVAQGTGTNTYNIRATNEGTGLSSPYVDGNARGEHSVDLQTYRTVATQVASGTYSVIGGGRQNSVSGINATVGGGFSNTASANYSTVGGGRSNYTNTCSSFIFW